MQLCVAVLRVTETKAAILTVINVGMSASPHLTKWPTAYAFMELAVFCPHLIPFHILCQCHHHDHDHHSLIVNHIVS